MATAKRNLEDRAKAKTWFVRNEQGGRFGPVDFETLKAWACDGRIGPTNEVSDNGAEWKLATAQRELEMDCVAEVTPGNFYGPIHQDAMQGLVKDGTIAAKAVLFRRCGMDAVRAAELHGLKDENDRLQQEEQSQRRVSELEEQVRLAHLQAVSDGKEVDRLRQELASQAEQVRRSVADQAAQIRQEQLRTTAVDGKEVDRLRQELAAQTEQARRSMASHEEQIRQAELRATADGKALDRLRQELASQAEEARRSAASYEEQVRLAQQRAVASDEELRRWQQQSEAQAEQAQEALRREQSRCAELDLRLSQAGIERDEAIRRLDAEKVEQQAQSAAWGAEKRALAVERQTLQAEVTRALAETASRTGRVAQLEKALAETSQEAEQRREGMERQINALRAEVSSAKESFAEQCRMAQQSQYQVVALTEALDSAKHGLDGEQMHLAALSKELAACRQEADHLREALRQKADCAGTGRGSVTMEVLEAEPLNDEPRPKVKSKPRQEPLEAEVLSPSRPASEHRPPPSAKHSGRGPSGISLADLEQQARRELERLGAQGTDFFAKKR